MQHPKPYHYIIVGAGLFGATFARLATDAGCRCLVIDKRHHTGGNIHCENIDGITVHAYGAHIFHTDSSKIWDFVNSFVPFNRFTNSPLAIAPDGNIYNLPFNMNTFHQIWPDVVTPQQAQLRIEQQRAQAERIMAADGVSTPRNLEEMALSLVGSDIYRLLVKGYTEKQWGRPCAQLPAFIIKRLPVRFTYDNNYFNDPFQGIPVGGYNALIDRLLEGADILLDTDFFNNPDHWKSLGNTLVFSGRIDQFYNFRYGRLEYRSLRFETSVLNTPNAQGNAVVNYTDAQVPYTRIIEHKHFEAFGNDVYKNPRTVLTHEYPAQWQEGMEPFYPVNDQTNQTIYNQYRLLAEAETSVIFGGRLAEYRYYDMAPVIARAMELFENHHDGPR